MKRFMTTSFTMSHQTKIITDAKSPTFAGRNRNRFVREGETNPASTSDPNKQQWMVTVSTFRGEMLRSYPKTKQPFRTGGGNQSPGTASTTGAGIAAERQVICRRGLTSYDGCSLPLSSASAILRCTLLSDTADSLPRNAHALGCIGSAALRGRRRIASSSSKARTISSRSRMGMPTGFVVPPPQCKLIHRSFDRDAPSRFRLPC